MANEIDMGSQTHQVFNQPPELTGYNAYQKHRSLQQALQRGAASWAESMVNDYGELVTGELREAGFIANQNPPEFYSHDRFGHRLDEVKYHPAYHQLMTAAIESGWPTLPWSQSQPGVHVARTAMQYLHHQADSGTGCPLTMSFAVLPVIRQHLGIASSWESLLIARSYDQRNTPYFKKSGVTIGMGMTEKQGGTDVEMNTTSAAALGSRGPGESYEIIGHKWFMSAPMSDAFLMLAQTDKGLSCFLMPRWRPDGSRNQLYIQRLKNKLGNHSNASAEVEFRNAMAWLVGEEGHGVATILEMVALTRFDCMVASAALMRQAVVQALHHCQYRKVAGRYLIDQPLMRNVLCDLIVESEAALLLAMRVATALDKAANQNEEKLLLRIATPIGKYWNCKRAPTHIYEAMECLGGGGYIEESVLPRIYREAPVNSIWEGSGNVQCLDVLRVMNRDKDCLEVLINEIKLAQGMDSQFDQFLRRLEHELSKKDDLEYRARRIVGFLALALQASLFLRYGQAEAASCFCSLRLAASEQQHLYGSLGNAAHNSAILSFAWP